MQKNIMHVFIIVTIINCQQQYEQEETEEEENLFQNDYVEDLNYKKRSFTQDGQCLEDYSNCIKYSDLSFQSIFSRYSDKMTLDIINKKIYTDSQYIFKKIEANIIDGKIKLFAKAPIDENEKLADFKFSKLFTTERVLNLKLFKPNSAIRNQFKSFEFKNLEDKYGFTSYFATQLLSHLYNFEDSLLQTEMLMLPRDLKLFPLISLTEFELNMIKDDEASIELRNFRKMIKLTYQNLIKRLFTEFTKQEIRVIFNGRVKIPVQDYAYAFMILYTNTLQKYSLPGLYLSSNKFDLNSTVFPFQYSYSVDEDDNQIISGMKINSPRQIQQGQEIYFDFNERQQNKTSYYLMSGQHSYEPNLQDCVELIPLQRDLAELYNHSLIQCVGETLLFHFEALENTIKMSTKQYTECQKILKTQFNSQEMKDTVNFDRDLKQLNECPIPEWSKNKGIFKNLNSQLDIRLVYYSQMYERSQEYNEYRLQNNLSNSNALALQTFLYSRLKLTQHLLKLVRKKIKQNKQLFLKQEL